MRLTFSIRVEVRVLGLDQLDEGGAAGTLGGEMAVVDDGVGLPPQVEAPAAECPVGPGGCWLASVRSPRVISGLAASKPLILAASTSKAVDLHVILVLLSMSHVLH